MRKPRIVVLGATGMLGSAVYLYFRDSPKFEVIGTHRGIHRVPYAEQLVYYNPLSSWAVDRLIRSGDYVVNCIGIIRPYVERDKFDTIFINSLYPHLVASQCQKIGARLVHITTDCVFSGVRGLYTEDDPHDALDIYGKSKSLGEPDGAMVLRTSIIGREQHSYVSLVEWFLKQDGQEVNGFVNHWWNGITTQEYARIIERIVTKDLYVDGIRHIFANQLTKYDMLVEFRRILDSQIAIRPVEAPAKCDRTLATKYDDLLPALEIRSFREMLNDLVSFSQGSFTGVSRSSRTGPYPTRPAGESPE